MAFHLTSYDGSLELIEIDLTAWGDEKYRFVNSKIDETTYEFADLVWQGNTYVALPFQTAGWKRGGEGQERPKIECPDFDGLLDAKLDEYDGAAGAPITRYQVLAADVLADDPNAPFGVDKFMLYSASGDGMTLSLELATPMDYRKTRFPAFTMTRQHYPGLGKPLLR